MIQQTDIYLSYLLFIFTFLIFNAAKLRIIFQSNKLFRVNVRFWRELLTFDAIREVFGQEKKIEFEV